MPIYKVMVYLKSCACILLLLGFGCNFNDAKKTLKREVDLAFATATSQTATTADTWSGLCIKLTVRFIDPSGDATTLPEASTLTFGSTTGTLYSGADCSTTSITTLAVAAGASSVVVYYKTTAGGGSDTVTAGLSSTNRISLAITIVTPTADIVLGQPDMTTTNWDCIPNATTVCEPMDVLASNGKVWLADGTNNRVLIWNTTTPESGSAADMVLGQANLTSNVSGATSTAMEYPSGIHIQGARLFVVDSKNHRILIWNTLPLVDQATANYVMGQPDLTTDTANTGGISARTFNWAGAIDSDGAVIVANDYYNNRVLIWNSIPLASDSSAAVVLGQPNMTSNGTGSTRTTFNVPWLTTLEDGKLFVGDYDNHRILVWNSIPTVDQQPPDLVIGQADFTSVTANRGGGVAANTIFKPGHARIDSQGRLFISDYGNNRILIFNKVPSESGTSADAVIGQVDLTASVAGTSDTAVDGPWTMSIFGNYLWISDYDNNRVLRMPVP